MPRGAKVDLATTKTVREIGLLQDRRSFISLSGHGYLKGADVCAARVRAIERATDREHQVVCEKCGVTVHDGNFEMHHLKNRTWERCDCDHNLAIWCVACHRERHNQ